MEIENDTLARWYGQDVEELLAEVAHQLPTTRRQILAALFDMAAPHTARDPRSLDDSQLNTLLTVAQLCVSEISFFDDPAIPTDWIFRLLDLASRVKSPTVERRAVGIAHLIANRLVPPLPFSADDVSDALAGLLSSSTDSATIQAINDLVAVLRGARERTRPRRTRTPQPFDLPGMDLTAAVKATIVDSSKDWFHDPWDWPEFSFLLADNCKLVNERLLSHFVGWSFPLDVPKARGGVRPATVLDPLDRIAFQAIVDELSASLLSNLPAWVYGWRLHRTRPRKASYEDNSTEWREFQDAIKEHATRYRFAIHVDVRSFFETVDISRLLSESSKQYRSRNHVVDKLELLLRRWQSRQNGRGLPQRCLPSSLLAHVPLSGVDAVLQQIAALESGRFSPLRWMDDIWLFSSEAQLLETAISEVEYMLNLQGLGLNPEKTQRLSSSEVLESSQRFMLESGTGDIDEGLEVRLGEISEILEHAEEAPRGVLKIMAALPAEGEKVAQVIKSLDLRKHDYVADLLGIAMRKHNLWPEHVQWYLSQLSRHSADDSWTIPSWCEMFPDAVPEVNLVQELVPVTEALDNRFNTRMQKSLVPIAAHRLTTWNPDTVDALIAYVGRSLLHPFELRALAYAISRRNKTAVAKLLSQANAHDADIIVECANRLDT